MKKTKVLFIHHGTGIGGAPTSLFNLVKNLDKDKYDAKVAFVKSSPAEDMFKEHGIATEVINSSNLWFTHNQTGKIQPKYFYRYFKIYRHWQHTAKVTAKAYLENSDADIVHLNSHVLTSWAYAARKAGKKVVLHNREAVARGYFGVRYKILKRLIEDNVDYVINISQDNMNRLGITKNATVIYNFVDIPQTYRPTMSNPEKGFKVLYLGGMAKIKGFETAAKCLPYLNDNITILFGGGIRQLEKGEGFKETLKYYVKIGLYRGSYGILKDAQKSKHAKVVGMIKNVLPVIDECDILITPFKIEHFSRPAVEAFAYGKPVVGSNVVGMDEIIDNGVNGILVDKNDPKALADALNYLCDNPDIARQMGKEGHEKAKRLFSPEQNTKMVEAIYQQLMGR